MTSFEPRLMAGTGFRVGSLVDMYDAVETANLAVSELRDYAWIAT